jgi:ribosomal protein S27AE
MTDAMRSYIEGMSVSVDVSTGDGDAHHRYFGTVTEVMDDPDDKHGVTLLVQDAKASFKPACPKCGGRTAVDHNNSFRCHRCQQAWPLRPEWTESEGDAK